MLQISKPATSESLFQKLEDWLAHASKCAKALRPLLKLRSLAALGAVWLMPACATPNSPPSQALKGFNVTTQRQGGVTHFYVENEEFCEVTMTFEMNLVNLKCSQPLPCTATFPPRKVTEAFALEPNQPEERWEYSYTNYYKLGSSEA